MSILLTNGGAKVLTRPGGLPIRSSSGKSALTPSDFTLLGAFRIPGEVAASGKDAFRNMAGAVGFAHRYVGGQLRFMLLTGRYTNAQYPTSHQLVEFAAPASLGSPLGQSYTFSDVPLATLVRYWDTTRPYHGALWTDQNGGHSDLEQPDDPIRVSGLYWDAVQSRLYWTYALGFSPGIDPHVGCCTLDDSTGVITPIGSWRTGSCRYGGTGVTAIPEWFASQHLNGYRLATGFGTARYSQANNGPVSYGPSVVAIETPNIVQHPHKSVVPHEVLQAYPFTGGTTQWCQRPGPYHMYDFETRPAVIYRSATLGGTGVWTEVDGGGAAVWIDTDPNNASSGKHGLVGMCGLGHGALGYLSSSSWWSSESTYWYIVDPSEYAAVKGGTKLAHQVPVSFHRYEWPDIAVCPEQTMHAVGTINVPGDHACSAYQVRYARGPYRTFGQTNFVGVAHAGPQQGLVQDVPWEGTGQIPGRYDGFATGAKFDASFDPTTNRLYVCSFGAWYMDSEQNPMVYVYQVA